MRHPVGITVDRHAENERIFGGASTPTVDAGTLITAGSSREIFRLARTDPLRVYVSLPQAYSQMVKLARKGSCNPASACDSNASCNAKARRHSKEVQPDQAL